MKIIGKILIVIFTLTFLWITLVTIRPIKPNRLKSHFQACDINNISSWGSIQGEIKQITSLKTPPGKPEDYIEFSYDNSPHNPYFSCKSYIPTTVLYKATTINLRYKLNQPTVINIGIHRVGQGPGWKPVPIGIESVDKEITTSWPIDSSTDGEPRLNWLSGPYEEVTFGITDFNRAKPLVITIYEVYFE